MATDKTFRLQVLGADEDVPRALRAYGRACGGEFAFLMEPDQFAYLAFLKGDKGYQWSAARGHVDAPAAPGHEVLPKLIVAEVQRRGAMIKKAPAGHITYRGHWKGTLTCRGEGKAPIITLTRKVAAYAVITIESVPSDKPQGGKWKITIRRDTRWFGQAKSGGEQHESYLRKAMINAYSQITGLVGEACSVRDTMRRSELDRDYAKEHPTKRVKDPQRDATERVSRHAKEPGTPPVAKPAKSKAPKAAKAPKESKVKEPKAPKEAPKPKAPKTSDKPKPKESAAKRKEQSLSTAEKDAKMMGAIKGELESLLGVGT